MIPSAKLLSKYTEHCLVLGRYATAREHSLEVLLIHLQSCYLRSKDSDLNLWFLMGIIIRLAVQLGYHRDPSKIQTFKLLPFEGEMRRRVWATIFQLDTLMSFQMGLPSMISVEYCDTELPRNLENSDFLPETPVLPHPRPLSDITPVLYTIVKSSIMSMFRAVIGHTRSLISSPYDNTMALDAQLRDAYSKVPAALRYMPISQSIVDSPGTIMDRTTIETLHLKSIIVLHRQYITNHRLSTLFDFSRSACLQAAKTLLERQVELHEATQPGSQLYDHRWMVSALMTNDFILAAMIICLELTIRTHRPVGSGREAVSNTTAQDAGSAKYIDMLQRCQRIWATVAEFSTEARTASDAIESTTRRILACVEVQPEVPGYGSSHPTLLHGNNAGPSRSPSQSQWPIPDDEAAYIDWVSSFVVYFGISPSSHAKTNSIFLPTREFLTTNSRNRAVQV